MYWQRKKRIVKLLLFLCVICLPLFLLREALPAEETLDIEKLTQGKVKVGDLITKDNVDLVKDFLTAGAYQLVKEGMVIIIQESPKPYEVVPKWYRAESERIHKEYGEPVIDQNAVIYTKDGKPWPGGTPFLHPSNVLEVLANAKYEHAYDDYHDKDFWHVDPNLSEFHDGEKFYKKNSQECTWVCANGRLTIPPLGTISGLEDLFYRMYIIIAYPFDLKGIGQLMIRYWDDVKNPDQGFAYLSSFKRVVRISATTWQDNLAGGDWTWGDPGGGYLEPYVYWNFKLIAEKPQLIMDYFSPFPKCLADGVSYDYLIPHDGPGNKFPREKWSLMNMYVVESTPKIKHVYGKRVQLIATPAYSPSQPDIVTNVDYYDPQGKLWKANIESRCPIEVRGERITTWKTQFFYDLQTGHSTQSTTPQFSGIDEGTGGKALDPRDLTLKTLISKGR